MAVKRITKSVSLEMQNLKLLHLIVDKYGDFSKFVNAKVKEFAEKGK